MLNLSKAWYETHTTVFLLLFSLVMTFLLSTQIAGYVPLHIVQIIPYINIVLSIFFVLSNLLPPLNRFRLPLLFAISAFIAITLFQLAGSIQYLSSILLIVSLITLVIFILSFVSFIDLSNRQLILSIGSFCAMILMILLSMDIQLLSWITLVGVLAMLCFSGLLHNIFRSYDADKPINFSSGVFMLNIGMMVSIIIMGGV